MDSKPKHGNTPRAKRIKLRGKYINGVESARNVAKERKKPCYLIEKTVFEVDEKYVPYKIIGRGSYGTVCSSSNKETNEKVAIKKICNVFENKGDAVRILKELKILRQLKHKNIISLKDIMRPTHKKSLDTVYLVYELMDTDLHHIIASPQPLSNDHCKYFMFQILQGLNYLHSANILHRDLKPENLLVNANGDLKICDLGLARACGGTEEFMTDYVVTRWYRAPELLCGSENYGAAIDIWSVGCIFAEFLSRKPLFQGRNCLHQLKVIYCVLGTPILSDLDYITNSRVKKYIESLPFTTGMGFSNMYPEADPKAIDLLEKMLEFDPRKRITSKEALQHPYFSDLADHGCSEQTRLSIDLDMEEENVEMKMIRDMMWEEILHYHPDDDD